MVGREAEGEVPQAPFVTAFITFAFLNTGLALGVWLLFDEHVAKPINRLSADLRLRAHSDVETAMDAETARYLGDLAPAANALSRTASASVMDTASMVARETRKLREESERLTTLLSEMPIATILLNPAQEIVLYDAQAARVLSEIAPPRLKAPLSDYFDPAELQVAIARLSEEGDEVTFGLRDTSRDQKFEARLKGLGDDGHMIFIEVEGDEASAIEARPLVFDFDLMNASESREIAEMPLLDLCFVPFDTETTGLSVETDAIVQLGAVRVLNGRIVEGEVLDCYVNPGRPIPPASTKIHHVTDDDVADAPDIAVIGRAFHHFARDAVLVAHNAPFDIGILRRFGSETGVEWDHPVLDTVFVVVGGVRYQRRALAGRALRTTVDRNTRTFAAHSIGRCARDGRSLGQAVASARGQRPGDFR